MGYTIGGAAIERYSFERGWGVNPSAASGVAVPELDLAGDPSATGLNLGEYVVFSFGSVSFYGIMAEIANKYAKSGIKQNFTILDNRIRLGGQIVFGQWNMEEPEWGDGGRIQPDIDGSQYGSDSGSNGNDSVDSSEGLDSPTAVGDGGVLTDPDFTTERRRRYYSILPDRWGAQIKMWHDQPLTVREILNSAFNGAIGSFGFTRNYHADQGKPVIGVDANDGASMSNLVSRLNRESGLDVTIDGQRTLRWERRGTGTFIIPSSPVCMETLGTALSREATKITVVGDRALVQLNNVVMEPDWKDGWEPFVSEVAWLREVEDVWDIDTSDKEGLAERAALAREVTLDQYVKEKEGDQSDMHDFRRWGEISRMMIPVWVYVNEIVFRSYRIPVDNVYKGVPLNSMDLVSGLLAGVEITGAGASTQINYRDDPVEYYPAADAFVMGRGQPLDFLDERSYELFGRRREKDLRTEWSVLNDYEIDSLNKSIHFKTPVFLDGDPDEGESIMHYPNRGDGGSIDLTTQGFVEGKDLLDIVVPNPDYVISAAEIKACFVFAMGKFSKQYGTGMNRASYPVPSLAMHLIDLTGGLTMSDSGVGTVGAGFQVPSDGTTGLKEILYYNGFTAEEQADEVAHSVIQIPSTRLSGSYIRYGSAGVVLAPYHDSIKVDIAFGGGITERVALSKSRAGAFQGAYEVEERQRARELYPKQNELAKRAEQIRRLGRLSNKKSGKSNYENKDSFPKVFANPVGDNKVSTAVVPNTDDIKPSDGTRWNSGHVMWLDADGKIDNEGKRFGGVVIVGDGLEEKTSASYHVAKRGEVPVLVQGPFKTGDSCGCDNEETFCKVGGDRQVGSIASGAEYTGGDKVLAMVRLGVSAEKVGCIPWNPTYKNEGTAEAPDWKLYLDSGTVNGILNDDWNEGLSIGVFADLYYIVLDVSLTDGKVSEVAYSLEANLPPFAEVDPMTENVLPTSLKIVVGSVKEGLSCMIWTQNLSVTSDDALHEPKAGVELGELPYTIWWKLIVGGV